MELRFRHRDHGPGRPGGVHRRHHARAALTRSTSSDERRHEPVVLTGEEKAQLVSLANSRSVPHGIVRRAQIVLACAAGESNASIAPTTMPPTNIQRSELGSLNAPVTTSTSHPPMPLGSIKSNAGSASSPKWPYAAAPSPASPNSSKKSNSSSKTTTTTPPPSCGPPPLILSLPKSNVFAHIFAGHHTSVLSQIKRGEYAGPFRRRLRCSSSRGNGHCSSSPLADNKNSCAYSPRFI